MQLISGNFVILWVISFALYYLVPVKRQWIILALASALFYVIGTGGLPVGLLLTGVSTYACGVWLSGNLKKQKETLSTIADKEQKKAVKLGFEKRRKRVQILYFVLNLGILLFTKYMTAALPFLEGTGLLGLRTDAFFSGIVMPLGISFYTLTAIGYVVDVGREQCEAQENPGKLLLCLAYFPAITQGPFNRFGKLQGEFDRPHAFDFERMFFGVQRFVWGAFKKLVIADRINLFVGSVFGPAAPKRRAVSTLWRQFSICYSCMRIFRDTWIWRWASAKPLTFSCRKISGVPIFPGRWPNSGADGTLRWEHGLRIM